MTESRKFKKNYTEIEQLTVAMDDLLQKSGTEQTSFQNDQEGNHRRWRSSQ